MTNQNSILRYQVKIICFNQFLRGLFLNAKQIIVKKEVLVNDHAILEVVFTIIIHSSQVVVSTVRYYLIQDVDLVASDHDILNLVHFTNLFVVLVVKYFFNPKINLANLIMHLNSKQ